MFSKSRNLALLLVLICLTSLFLLPYSSVKAQSTSNSAPAIAWQKNYFHEGYYDNTGIESASNVIQTSDSGYAFMDLGWSYQFSFVPSTVFKVDSSGTIEWKKTIENFEGSAIIQTNDNGYEISGRWGTYGSSYQYTPTLIKTDSQGNIQWVQNYTSEPNLGVNSSRFDSSGSGWGKQGSTKTSDNGFVYWSTGITVKTDSSNNTQWIKNVTYPTLDAYPTYSYPLSLFSVIETSDGALAILGVGYNLLDNPRTGKIYILKTEPFLPTPSPTQLPTPIPTPMSPPVISNFQLLVVIIAIVVVFVLAISLLLYRRHRKTATLNS